MKDFLNLIFDNKIPVFILYVLALIFFLVEFFTNLKAIGKFFAIIGKFFRDKVWRFHKNGTRKRYNKTVSTTDFLDWQKKLLKRVYGDVVQKFNNEEKLKDSPVVCDYSSLFNHEYESVYFKSNNLIRAPFKELFNKEEVLYNDFDKIILKGIKKNAKHYQKKYYAIIKPTIHFPYNVGYMLKEFNFHDQNDNFHFKAQTGVYLQNVYESNMLEYELYKLYKKKKNIDNLSIDEILEYLPQRNAIHKNFLDSNKNLSTDIFTSGAGRNSLLSVSMMVLCKNKNGYDALRIRRSENVDAKVGFLQFVPSGGFSSLDAGLDFDSQYANASIIKGLLREFLEECFGEEDYSGVINHSPEDIYSNEIIKKIDLKKIYFIGTALSLVSLRHELCFLMVIDNEEIISKMKANDECDKTLRYVDILQLEKEEFWSRYSENNKNRDDILMLNATSAALYNLVRESDIYKSLKEEVLEKN